jgi:hypothetical protein
VVSLDDQVVSELGRRTHDGRQINVDDVVATADRDERLVAGVARRESARMPEIDGVLVERAAGVVVGARVHPDNEISGDNWGGSDCDVVQSSRGSRDESQDVVADARQVCS